MNMQHLTIYSMYEPVLISAGMTCHFFDQANYPIYQQHPEQIQNKQHGYMCM